MIEHQTINGKPAIVSYLTNEFEPTDPDKADLVKVIMDDQVLFLRADEAVPLPTFNPHHDEKGRFASGSGETYGGLTLPPPPGTVPIPDGDVRLYHQTNEENLAKIAKDGIQLSNAKGIEGPRAIYADEKGFYGDPSKVPTVEFHVSKERWSPPFVRADSEWDKGQVAPEDIIAVHYPWNQRARYIESDPNLIKEVVAGEHDTLLTDKEYADAIKWIKAKYGGHVAEGERSQIDPQVYSFNPHHDEHGRFASGDGYSADSVIDKDGTVHTDNVYDAARALGEGRKVELSQPRQVATLLDHLGQVAKNMIAAGKDAPKFNLCNVSVKGTNLFCAESKGIPRIEMPQLHAPERDEFPQWLADQGYHVTHGEEHAAMMRATQNELNGALVAKIAGVIRAGKYNPKPIIVSRDNYILDGHHTWAAMVGLDAADNKLNNYKKMEVYRFDISITDLLRKAEEFTGGRGKEAMAKRPKFFPTFNPNHDEQGKFTTGGGGDARLPGETDKQFAKRVVDKRPLPKDLPEIHDKYFVIDENTIEVPIENLVSNKTADENKQGGENGAKRMAAAGAGELSRRAPISVAKLPNGKYLVVDGNGTLTSVKRYHWKSLPVHVVHDSEDKVPIPKLIPKFNPYHEPGGTSTGGQFTTGPSLTVWHGSPHEFKDFDLDKIGTGEGAQTFGYGIYVAQNKDTATSYKKASVTIDGLSPEKFLEETPKVESIYDAIRYLQKQNPDHIVNIEEAAKWYDKSPIPWERKAAMDVSLGDIQSARSQFSMIRDRDLREEAEGVLESMIRSGRMKEVPGHLYEVDMTANTDKMLDLDAPLDAQPEAVQKLVAERDGKQHKYWESGTYVNLDLSAGYKYDPKTGNDILQGMERKLGSDKAVSQLLKDNGVPGIKYLDQKSRNASLMEIEPHVFNNGDKGFKVNGPKGDRLFDTKQEAQEFIDEYTKNQTRNFVLFDAKYLKVKNHYRLQRPTHTVPIPTFNPYHDERGRFTTGGGGKKPSIHSNMSRKGDGPSDQPTRDIDELFKKAKEAYPAFEKQVQQVADATHGKAIWSPEINGSRLKTKDRVIAKANSDYKDKNGVPDYSKVKDIVRGTVLYDTVREARLGAAAFIGAHGNDIVRVKDRYAEASKGYRDMLINYRLPNGTIAELQFNSREMMAAKMGEGHKWYEKERSVRKDSNFNLIRFSSFKERGMHIYARAYKKDGNGNWATI